MPINLSALNSNYLLQKRSLISHLFPLGPQSDHYEPSQREQDELARALEEVDEQVKSLEQMTGSTDFLESFLDGDDEILVDDADICTEVLTTTTTTQSLSGLVHT